MTLNIDFQDPDSYELTNWAAELDDTTLATLGAYVVEATETDSASREPWLADTEKWVNMAQQTIENKNTPWNNASAVKFPLLTTAALQFHARSHQELLKGERIVKGKVIGTDVGGEKAKRARRVEAAMTNQLLFQMEDWADDTDRLLFILPLVGTVFRKTYWSGLLRRPASELVLASELVVNYYATDWDRARKTHIFLKDKNEVTEQVRMGNYLDVDLPDDPQEPGDSSEDADNEMPLDMESSSMPGDNPYTLLEQHGWYDLDDDGYKEPYIVTVERETKKVLRIIPRFLPDRIEMVDENEILRIKALEYIVAYKFLPDVDSSIYGVGIGKLLGPTGAAIDTIINQLVDSGTLNTMPSGFIGRGVRLSRGGRIRLNPGEWKVVNSSGEDLKKNFFPMPTKEPSDVLFRLLGMLIQAGEKMGSVTEALSGQNPGQNQPFSTTSAVMEQGLQVFMGIYKRIYRSMTKEFQMLYQLNYMHLGMDSYASLLDDDAEPALPEIDFNPEGLDIVPEADPSLANSQRKQRRVAALIEGQRSGMKLNQQYVTKVFLESIDEPQVDEAMEAMEQPPTKEEIDQKQFDKKMKLEEMKILLILRQRENQPFKEMAEGMKALAEAKTLGDSTAVQRMEEMMQQMVALNQQTMQAESSIVNMLGFQAQLPQAQTAEQLPQAPQQVPGEMNAIQTNPNQPGAAAQSELPPEQAGGAGPPGMA